VSKIQAHLKDIWITVSMKCTVNSQLVLSKSYRQQSVKP